MAATKRRRQHGPKAGFTADRLATTRVDRQLLAASSGASTGPAVTCGLACTDRRHGASSGPVIAAPLEAALEVHSSGQLSGKLDVGSSGRRRWRRHARSCTRPGIKNDLLRDYVAATAAFDGYRAIVSWGEIDPSYEGKQVLLAQNEDGVPLGRQQLVLVVPGDTFGGRYVHGVTNLRLGSADSS